MRTTFLFRVRVISGILVLIALVLGARLYLLQVVRGEGYSEQADRQYVRPQEGLFERGSIFFEDKDENRVLAATLQSGFSLVINPTTIVDAEALYEELSVILPDLDKPRFLARASLKDDPYEVVATQITQEEADALEDLRTPGVSLFKEQWRYYPSEDVAARALGFVAFNEDTQEGRYGLERYYNDVLERATDRLYINFFAEVFSGVGGALSGDTQSGGDLVTTIEPSVQTSLEKELREITEEWGSRETGGIVINPKTGEIYAMAVHPTFDLNNFQKVEDASYFGNPLVEGVYEMGSIMKPITVAAGIDAGAVGPRTTYTDYGFLELDGGNARIANYDGRGRGTVDMYRVLGESLNTGAAFVVRQMGNEKFAEYLRDFGLDEETGIDLPGEVHGLLDNLESPRDVEYATASFGQGIALTPIATVRALSALGNGGRLITPHLVKRVEYEARPSKKIFYDQGKQVITPQTSETITKMLVNVVDEYLLGGTVKFNNYSVAAKTGTAQIADTVNGGYYDDRFLHSFFGYFPAYDPEFLVFLYTREPRGVRYASQTLTHPFIDLTKFLINYYEVPPDR